MERVRDFIILHYWLNRRDDTQFWRDCRAIDLPDTLTRKVEMWKRRGHMVRYRWEMFQPASWLAIYAGFDCLPDGYDPALDGFDLPSLSRGLAGMRKAIADTVADCPTHQEFIDRYAKVVV